MNLKRITLLQKIERQKENNIVVGYQPCCADKYFNLAPKKLIIL